MGESSTTACGRHNFRRAYIQEYQLFLKTSRDVKDGFEQLLAPQNRGVETDNEDVVTSRNVGDDEVTGHGDNVVGRTADDGP
jgi:hypothetical protein